MKQYIVLISMIMLGIYIFNIVAGEGEGSLNASLKNVWQEQVVVRTYSP